MTASTAPQLADSLEDGLRLSLRPEGVLPAHCERVERTFFRSVGELRAIRNAAKKNARLQNEPDKPLKTQDTAPAAFGRPEPPRVAKNWSSSRSIDSPPSAPSADRPPGALY